MNTFVLYFESGVCVWVCVDRIRAVSIYYAGVYAIE